MLCYCKSQKPFSKCCEPFLTHAKRAATPEELMRSRYSAYVLSNAAYIVATALGEQNSAEELELIKEYAKNIEWLGLEIVHAKGNQVEFKAYYRDGQGVGVQHEKSNFVQNEGMWLYKDGTIYNTKIERNMPCPCGSGKKYKKCCG